MKNRLALELQPISPKISAKGGYSAHVVDRWVLPTDMVMEEVIREHRLGLSPKTLRMYTEMVLDTMIENTLKDGYSRRLDNYFTLQVDVRGRFDEKGSDFDPKRHRIVLTLKPLTAMRRKASRDLVPYTKNNGPKVLLESLRSVSTPDSEWLKWGDDLVITGENLEMLDGDELKFLYHNQDGSGLSITLAADSEAITPLGDSIRVSWDETVGRSFKRLGSFRPVGIGFQLRSRGGVESANRQSHRIIAFFDTWAEYVRLYFPKAYPPKANDSIWRF